MDKQGRPVAPGALRGGSPPGEPILAGEPGTVQYTRVGSRGSDRGPVVGVAVDKHPCGRDPWEAPRPPVPVHGRGRDDGPAFRSRTMIGREISGSGGGSACRGDDMTRGSV